MKHYILSLFVLLSVVPLSAQTIDNDVLFKAMRDEMTRSQEQLVLPGAPKPFVISYAFSAVRQVNISATLGSIHSVNEMMPTLFTTVDVYLGDYHNVSRSVNAFSYRYNLAPNEADYNGVRMALWRATDGAYKDGLRDMGQKKVRLANSPLAEKEAALDDWQKVEPVTKIIEPTGNFKFEVDAWKSKAEELSALFKNYPDLFNTGVSIEALERTVYKLTSEGVMFKQPITYIRISSDASTLTDDGERANDRYELLVTEPGQLSDWGAVESGIKQMAENLMAWRNAPVIEEYYIGPVLFEDLAAERLFTNNLLNNQGLFAVSKYEKGSKTIASRLGKKILDENISIKNYSDLSEYKGVRLAGAYQIDADGIVPPPVLSLVEKGIFKNMLNNREPTLKAPASTGSSRITSMVYTITTAVAPGTVHITAEKTVSAAKLKSELLKMAKKQDLDYAYIVRKEKAPATYLYRVDVKTGEESMVRSADIVGLTLNRMRKIPGVSKQESIRNFMYGSMFSVPTSVISPQAVLLDDVEINVVDLQKTKQPDLQYPLKRMADKK